MTPLIELNHVSKWFSLGGKRTMMALKRVNLTVQRGETLGLLGESGCGKSTLARVIMGAYPPDEGQILFDGKPLNLRRRQERKAFAKRAQMIFQDPYGSLDPHRTVLSIISEHLEVHEHLTQAQREQRVGALLERTGLSADAAQRFPHEFSGGQRQRIGIARALAAQPEFLLCDEPVSALDRSIQRHIMDLLMELKDQLQFTCLFISHDLATVRRIADRIAVMYAGQIVEIGTAEELYQNPQHPYTELLLRSALSSIPDVDRLEQEVEPVRDEVLSLPGFAAGCAFANRCPHAQTQCEQESPELLPATEGHAIACFRKRPAASSLPDDFDS